MAVEFKDTFVETVDKTLANHTPDTGTGWTPIIRVTAGDESMKVEADTDTVILETGSLGDGVLYETDDVLTEDDYKVEVKVVNPDSGDDYCILAARIQNANNMYALQFNEDVFQLYKRTTAGGWVEIDTDKGGIVVAGDIVYLKVVGTTISAGVNDVEKASVVDESHSSAGKAGLGMGGVIISGGDMSSQEFDDFEVDTIPGFPPGTCDLLTLVPTNGNAPLTVNATVNGTNAVAAQIDWGEGAGWEDIEGFTGSHIYEDEGVFQVKARIQDENED